MFDGGLSVQEYDASASSQPQASTLQAEYIRGEGMGGGVGGMVYSIRNGQRIYSHANHRGDVIARTDDNRSLTSFALYEAYGTRPYEWSDGVTGDPDRQKANTKEEESDLGLLNEGMRFRDLETGVFLTRDPIGYGDGPNVYCYVHCNPITKFDPLGLKTIEDYQNDISDAQAQRDAALAELNKNQKKGTGAYNRANLNIQRTYSRAVSKAEKGINQICQTAASMSELTVSEIDPTKLDDDWKSYKDYRRTDWYLNFTDTKKFAKAWTDGDKKAAAKELAILEVKNIAAAFVGSKLGTMAAGGLGDDAMRFTGSVDDLTSFKTLGRGSTGRTTPMNLREQLAMEEVMSNPQRYAIPATSTPMKDPRWLAKDGWVKMRNADNTIHWVQNIKTGAVDDFKFK